MKSVKVIVPVQSEMEVPLCPACGCAPIVSPLVKTDQHAMEGSDVSITGYDVGCPCCGLGATLGTWNIMAAHYDNPFLPNA
jgi:hypothetical protein